MTSVLLPGEIFVVTAPGLEEVTGAELQGMGVEPLRRETGGLALPGDPALLWRLNLRLRTASRVLVRIARFRAVGFRDLEKGARRVPWTAVVPSGVDPTHVRFDVTCRKSRLYHSGAVEARLREALSEALEEGRRTAATGGPPGSRGGGGGGAHGTGEVPLPRFVVRLHRNDLTLSADASGEHLHRRGYREAVGKAPLRETLAAAMVLASGWSGETPLVDPFCGSGTLPIEAALLALGMAPGRHRRFAFEGWSGTDPEEGRAHREAAAGEPGPGGARIPALLGSDRDAGAVEAARANAGRAGVSHHVTFARAAVSDAPLPGEPGLLVTNPPYGHRVGEAAGLRNLYARLGERVRGEWSGGRVVLLSADRALTGQLGLETRVLFRTRNGGIPVEAVAADVP